MYYGVDKTTILHYAHKIGYDVNKTPKLSEEDISFIKNNYNKYTSHELAERFNVHQGYISQIWSLNGLTGKIKRIYSLDENCFSNIITEEQAYTLGFIASDGCISNNKNKQNTLSIAIHKNDISILEAMNKKVFKSNKPIYISDQYCRIEYSSDKIYNDLDLLGLHPRKTYGNTYVKLKDDLMKHFIRGYFDGDGCISWKNNQLCDVGISISGYKSNLDKIINYLEQFNIYASFIQDKRKKYNGCDAFGSLTLTNKVSKYSFLRYLYDKSTIFLDRKRDLAYDFINRIDNGQDISSKVIKTYYIYAVSMAN